MNWKVFFVVIAVLMGGLSLIAAWSEFSLWVGDHVGRNLGFACFMTPFVLVIAAGIASNFDEQQERG